MAKRKKKKKKSQSSRIAATTRDSGAAPETFNVESQRGELMKEARPLMVSLAGKSNNREEILENMVSKIISTEDIASAPEFKNTYFDLTLTMKLVTEQIERLAPDPHQLNNMSKKQRELFHLQVTDRCLDELLTREMKERILIALNQYRVRIKGVLGAKKVALAAAMLTFLADDKDSNLWKQVGVVRGIFNKSLAAGWEMHEEIQKMELQDWSESEELPTDNIPDGMLEQMGKGLFERQPELRKYYEDKLRKEEKSFFQTLMNADIYLGLYTREQLLNGGYIIAESMGIDLRTGNLHDEDFGQEQAKAMVDKMETFIIELAGDSWVDEVIDKLGSAIKNQDPGASKEYVSTMVMIREGLRRNKDPRSQMAFFMYALIGEIGRINDSEKTEKE